DPDVILVGEIRDEETAQIAFRAAMTGHTVLTTLHTQSAAAAIQQLGERADVRGSDSAAGGHGHRAQYPRDVRQLHRESTARPTPLPGVLRADERRLSDRCGAPGTRNVRRG